MENLVTDLTPIRGRRVLVFGHTGFKGSWMCALLSHLGCEVHGFALEPTNYQQPLFEDIRPLLTSSALGDVRDFASVRNALERCKPAVIVYLAAQSLVAIGYQDPERTFSVNVLGTVNVLLAAREVPSVRAIVIATSDKCYETRTSSGPYLETDPLGGGDPYSGSKAAAELAVSALRQSFFQHHGAALVATVRAGNVMGGGDFSPSRIVPDLANAMIKGQPLSIRHLDATRPWQHVLDPLAGYLLVAARLLEGNIEAPSCWNFGPRPEDSVAVEILLRHFKTALGDSMPTIIPDNGVFPGNEVKSLALDSSKALRMLGWSPRLRLEDAVRWTSDWYRTHMAGAPTWPVMKEQIESYSGSANRNNE